MFLQLPVMILSGSVSYSFHEMFKILFIIPESSHLVSKTALFSQTALNRFKMIFAGHYIIWKE